MIPNNDYIAVAKVVLDGVGGADNVTSVDNCITRLRLEVKDPSLVDENKIQTVSAGVIRPRETSVQVILGPQVQFVSDEFKKLVL